MTDRTSSDSAAAIAERPLRADARRNHERILEAARAVFSADGAEAQMDDVALRAGVGVGTLYRHFPTKDALLAELIRGKLTFLADSIEEALAREGERAGLLEDVLGRSAEVASRDAGLQQVLAGSGNQPWKDALAERERLDELTAELIDRAQRAGTVRADLQPSDIAMLMCGLSATMYRADVGFDWRRHLELILDGLRPAAADREG